MTLRPFIELRPEFGFSLRLSVERTTIYGLDPGDKTVERHWIPDVWLQVGPIFAGIGISL